MILRALLGPLLAAVLVLTGCSGDVDEPRGSDDPVSSDDPGSPDDTGTGESSSPTVAEAPYLPVPDGVELTAQGSELEVGDTATVAYEPRQDQVGVLDVKVTRLERASFEKHFRGWQLSKETRSTTPYFVTARIENVGDTDLGGRRVPLYIVDGNNTLVESSTFQSRFEPCASEGFPKRFRPSDSGRFCLVYLSPDKGELSAVSFRPTEDFNPIIWTGEVTKPGADQPKGKGKGKNKGKNKGGQGGG